MSFEFTDLERAQSTNGLYMTVVPGIPSPWTEAAKGILHIKNMSWSAVRFDARDKAMRAWTQSRSAPTLMNEHDSPRSDWLEILQFAESHAPEPALLPEEPALQQQALELCKLICAESGLGWNRRLHGIHSGLTGEGGFPEPIATYLG
ncbi:MAG: hypothetical protein MI864_27515, partial [Pseudomonadales bacterium]|nr:hypothetical protein [Pseudomonadales bacterium]